VGGRKKTAFSVFVFWLRAWLLGIYD